NAEPPLDDQPTANPATFYHFAFEGGWRPEREYTNEELERWAKFAQEHGGGGSATEPTQKPDQTDEAPFTHKREARIKELCKKVAPLDPVAAMKMPPPTHWDKDRLLIHSYGGSVNMIYAEYSNYKTTWSVGHALHTAKRTGCRILYVVGEGAHGFGPKVLQ